jgi:hypothetical protein
MRTKIISILFLFLFFDQINAQEFAEFTTDTSRINGHMRERISKELWYINGQEMHYDGKTIKIKVNPDKFDTIIYFRQNQKTYDTVLCNVASPNKYTLIYNECCSFFNIKSKTTRINHSILFKLKNNYKNDLYLGSIYSSGGATGILVDEKTSQAAYSICHSAMSSHHMYISFSEIKMCEWEDFDYENEDCNHSACLLTENGVMDDTEIQYKSLSTKMNLSWLCLNSDPLIVLYDPVTDKISYE